MIRRPFVLMGFSLIVIGLMLAPALTIPAQSASPDQLLRQAWQRAQQSGAYHFAAETNVTSYPAPNVGSTAKTETLFMDGAADRPERRLELRLWKNGGSVVTGKDGIEIRVVGDQAEGRPIGGTEWQPIDKFTGLFAPDNDPAAFLVSAVNVREVDKGTGKQVDKGRYQFDLDGPAFARYVRDTQEQYLQQHGELPANLSLGLSDQYLGMTGTGEAWLDANGLPLRLIVTGEFPQLSSGERIAFTIKTDFSDFAPIVAQAPTLDQWLRPLGLSLAADGPLAVARLLSLSGVFGLMLLLSTRGRSKRLYAATAIAVIGSMIIAPMAQAAPVVAFADKQAAQQAEHEQRQADAQSQQRARDQLLTSDWDPAQPIGAQLSTQRVLAQSSLATTPLNPLTSAQTSLGTTGMDTDKDGLSDDDEINTYHTDPKNPDTDGDTLLDGVEVKQLGTLPNADDSDHDGITDNVEVGGWLQVGRKWYTDPRQPDTNRDGQADGAECRPQVRPDEQHLSVVALCPDTNQNGTPDVFDADNDGDRVPDRADLSINAWQGPFGDAQPFQLTASGIDPRYDVWAELQVRPLTATHLTYALNVLDWPDHDQAGQVRTVTDTQVMLLPSLEILLHEQTGQPAPLPRTTPHFTTSVTLTDTGWLSATLSAWPTGADTQFTFHWSGAAADVMLQTGACLSPTQAPAGKTILQWNGLNNGDQRTAASFKVLSLADAAFSFALKRGEQRACLDVPHLAHGLSTTQIFDVDLLSEFSITVRDVDQQGTVAAYVPLGVTTDETGGQRVALTGRMLYRPAGTAWAAQDVRLVWLVQASDPFGAGQMLHTYYDDFTLTGAYLVEDHGVQLAIAFPDPAVETPDRFDTDLWQVTNGLNASLVAGRTNAQGQRDVTIASFKARFDNPSTDPAATLQRWGLAPNAVRVLTYTLPDQNQFLQLPRRFIPEVLNTYFTQNGAARVEAPTLLVAREETYRSVNLANKDATVRSAHGMEFQLNRTSLDVNAGITWGPFHLVDGVWHSMPLDDYQALAEPRYRAELLAHPPKQFDPNGPDADRALEGLVKLAQSYYASLTHGAYGLVQQDNRVTEDHNEAQPDEFLFKFRESLASLIENIIDLISEWHEAGIGNTWLAKLLDSNLLWMGVVGVLAVMVIILGLLWDGKLSDSWAVAVNMTLLVISVILLLGALYKLEELLEDDEYFEAASGSALAWGVVLAVVGLIFIWVAFLVWAHNHHVARGSLAYQLALDQLVIVSLQLILFAVLALALGPIGVIIGVAVAIVDVLDSLICKAAGADESKWYCTGISGLLSKGIGFLMPSRPIIGNYEDADRLKITDFQQRLVNPHLGFTAGSAVRYSLDVSTTITLAPRPVYYFEYDWQFRMSNLRKTTVNYALTPEKLEELDAPYEEMADRWIDSGDKRLDSPAFTPSLTATLDTPGLNCSVDAWLTEGIALPYQKCYPIGVCYVHGLSNAASTSLSDTLKWDVLPAMIDGFYHLKPQAGGYTLDWGAICATTVASDTVRIDFARQPDADGDGAQNPLDGGNDPDDSQYDIDGDGLPDGYELDRGSNPKAVDSDADGLIDPEEFRLRTNTLSADTDGDGLNDFDEGQGWSIVYAFDAQRRPLSTWVRSDPLSADEDDDGYLDFQEKQLGLHPQVYNNSTVLDYNVDLIENQAAQLLLRFEERSGARSFADTSGGRAAACATRLHCPTAGVSGRYGNAVKFSGAQVITTELPLVHQSFTVAFWAKPSGSGRNLIIGQGTPQNNQGLHIGFRSDSVFTCAFYDDDLDAPAASGWHHYACTYDQATSTRTIYRDGQLAGSDTAAAYTGVGPLQIGRGMDSLQSYYSGELDELVIYTVALDQPAIADVMQAKYQYDDGIYRPAEAAWFDGMVTNDLNSRYAQGLLTTQAPITVVDNVPPQTFILQPGASQAISGPFSLAANATTSAISLTQIAGAQIVDWRAISNYADAWWPLNEPTGATTFADRSGNQPPNDLTCAAPQCPQAGQPGAFDRAARFDGVQSQLLISDLPPASMGYSIALWTQSTANGQRQTFVTRAAFESEASRLTFAVEADRSVTCGFPSGGESASTPSNASDGAWHHWACTYDGTNNLVIYRDGVALAQKAINVAHTVSGTLTLGAAWGQAYFNGLMDDVRVYSRGITANEINQIVAQPVLHLPFEGSNPQFTDSPGLDDTAGAHTTACARYGSYDPIMCPLKTMGVVGQAAASALQYGAAWGGVAVTPRDDLKLSDGTFTQAAWIYPGSAPGSLTPGFVIMGRNCDFATVSQKTYPCLLQRDRSLMVAFGDGSAWSAQATFDNVLTLNTWQHVAATFDGTTYRVYVNGQQVGSDGTRFAGHRPAALDGPLYVGVLGQPLGSQPMSYNVAIDEALLYRTALSSDAINRLVQVGVPRYFRFDDAPGAGQTLAGYVNSSDVSSATNARCAGDVSTCPLSGVIGRLNLAARFDGQNDAARSTPMITLANTSFSVAFWAKRDQSGRWDLALGQGSDTSADRSLHVGFRSSDKFTCAFSSDDLDTPAYTDTNWHHWTCTFEAASRARKIYRDGAVVASDTARSAYQGSGDLFIGTGYNQQYHFAGLLDDVRVYARALSASDVLALVQAAPQVQLHFEETNAPSGFHDEAGNLNGMCSGSACPQAGQKGQVGLAARFGVTHTVALGTLQTAGLTGDFTVLAWLKADRYDAGDQAVLWAGAGRSWWLGVRNGYAFMQPDTYSNNVLSSTLALSPGVWQHVAYRIHNGSGSIILSGVINANATNLYLGPGGSLPLSIGNNSFNGLIDELSIYARALGDDEIRSVFEQQAAYVEDRAAQTVRVDADLPTSALTSVFTGGPDYRPRQYQVLSVSASDPTSGVALVEVGVTHGSQTTWKAAPLCQSTNLTAAWCPAFEPIFEGAHTLQTRATDKAGWRETPTSSYTFYVDGSVPDATSDTQPGTLVAAQRDLQREVGWIVPLSGYVNDPILTAGLYGSGVASVQVNLIGPGADRGEQPAAISGVRFSSSNRWSINYPFDKAPTGLYTPTITSRDFVGNEQVKILPAFYLDSTPPSVTFESTNTPTTTITRTLVLTGTAVETPTLPGEPIFGVQSVEAALVGEVSLRYNEVAPPNQVLHLPLADGPDVNGQLTFRDVAQGLIGVCPGFDCPTPGVSGHHDAAARFDGVRDYIDMPPTANLNPAGQLTLAAWINATNPISPQVILAKSPQTGGSGYEWVIANRQVQLRYWDTTGVLHTGAADKSIGPGWTHVAVTVDTTASVLFRKMYFYLNGAPAGSASVTNAPLLGNAVALRVGALPGRGRGDYGYFNGSLQNVRVFNRALEFTEIKQLYSGGDPQLLLGFDESVGAVNGHVFRDTSPWARRAVLHSGAISDTANKLTTGQVARSAVQLDGVDDQIVVSDNIDLVWKPFTVAFWAKHTWQQNRWDIAVRHGTSGQSAVLRVGFEPGDALVCDINGERTTAFARPVNNPDGWHHFACTYDPAAQQRLLYRDGELISSSAPGSSGRDSQYNGLGPIIVGADPAQGQFFKGALDDVRVYDQSLTPAEIHSLVVMGWQATQMNHSGSGVAQASWAITVPTGLEGDYALALRATDMGGNRMVTGPQWWQGTFDTRAPYGWLYYEPNANPIKPQLHLVIEDYNLDPNSITELKCLTQTSKWGRCTPTTANLTNYQTPWYLSAAFGSLRPFHFDRNYASWIWQILTDYSGASACDVFGNCASYFLDEPRRPDRISAAPWGVGAIVTSPAPDEVSTAIGVSVPITGELYGSEYARALTVTLDQSVIFTQTWPPNTLTETTWSTAWLPAANGDYVLGVSVSDWATSTTMLTQTLRVDSDVPTITLDVNTLRVDAARQLELRGTVTDSHVSQVTIDLSSPIELHNIAANVIGNQWIAAAPVGPDAPLDGTPYTVAAHARDAAGRITSITHALNVDVQPPALGAVTLERDGQSLGAGDIFTTSVVNVTALFTVSESSLQQTWIAWTDSPSAPEMSDPRVITVTPITQQVIFTSTLIVTPTMDGVTRYFHYGAIDQAGNAQADRRGPIYHDVIGLPDYGGFNEPLGPWQNQPYRGWLPQCTLIGRDVRSANTMPVGSTLYQQTQQLHVTRDQAALRLTWTGADWDTDGDLFIYLDTVPDEAQVTHGGNLIYNPYPATSANTIGLLPTVLPPTSTLGTFSADFAVWVQDAQVARLLQWNSGTQNWGDAGPIEYRFDRADQNYTDLRLPFTSIGLTHAPAMTLSLVAIATRNDALRIWSVMPPQNPAADERVTWATLPVGQPLRFMLTEAYDLDLSDGACLQPQGRLQVTLTGEPGGVNVNWDNDTTQLIAARHLAGAAAWEQAFVGYAAAYQTWLSGDYCPTRPFDANCRPDKPPALDVNDTLGTLQSLQFTPVQPGQTLRYALHFANDSARMYHDVIAVMTAENNAVTWPNACNLIQLGDWAAWTSGEATFTGQAGPHGAGTITAHLLQAADLIGLDLSACTFTSFAPDAMLAEVSVMHTPDDRGPTISLDQPTALIGEAGFSARGSLIDASLTPTITLEIKANGATSTVTCLDAQPTDGDWQCAVSLTASGQIQVRAQAVDTLGQVGAWTAWRTLTVDAVVPSVAADQAGALLTGSTPRLSGTAADDHLIDHVQVCDASGVTCDRAALTLDATTVAQRKYTYDDTPVVPIPIAGAALARPDLPDVCGPDTVGIWRTFHVTETFTVASVQVGVMISHPYRSDVVVKLWSPAGAGATLIQSPERVLAPHYSVWLSDFAADTANDDRSAHTLERDFAYTRRAVQPLSTFAGENAQGAWTLIVCDVDPAVDLGAYVRGELRFEAAVTPQASRAHWQAALSSVPASDNVPYTSLIKAWDSVGHVTAQPVTYRVDNVAPQVTATQLITSTIIAPTVSMLTGSVSDGDVVALSAVMIDPQGKVTQHLLDVSGGAWHVDVQPRASGTYVVQVQAIDRAGNQTQSARYTLTVLPFRLIYLPMIRR